MLLAFYSYGQQAGKDTAGIAIQQWCHHHGTSYERRGFADKMKLLCAAALGHSAFDEGAYDQAIEVMNDLKLHGVVGWSLTETPTPPYIDGRGFIINLAQGARKLFGQDFWIKQTLTDLVADVTVITDLRFDLEADAVHEAGGIVVEIVNSRAQNAGGRSEEGIDPNRIDHRIWNEGTLEEYREAVQAFMSILWTGHE